MERVEGFASPAEWSRAYGEINDFEEELGEAGIVVAKFWLAIGKDEQLRRFEARAGTEYKQFKITAEDWRNREKWDLYHDAIGEMIDRTSTPPAPWTAGRGAGQAVGAGQGAGDAGGAAGGRTLAPAQNQQRPETSSVDNAAPAQRVEHLPGAGDILTVDADEQVGLADHGDLDHVVALGGLAEQRANATLSRSMTKTTDAASSGSTVCCSSSRSAAATGAAAIAEAVPMARFARIIAFLPHDPLAGRLLQRPACRLEPMKNISIDS